LRDENIPSDVLHLDCYWQRFGNWSDLQWNTDAFPDPESMVRMIKNDNFKLCLWINPYLGAESERFLHAKESATCSRRRLERRTSFNSGAPITPQSALSISRTLMQRDGGRNCFARF